MSRKLTVKDRELLVARAKYLHSKASQIGYDEIRPFWTDRFHTWEDLVKYLERGGTFDMDCSESVQNVLYRLAGLANPSGNVPVGSGYTGTMYAHLKHFRIDKPERAREGAIGIYKYPEGATVHAIMAIQGGKDNPLVFSHGSPQGPLILPVNEESAAHPGQDLIWCDVEHLG